MGKWLTGGSYPMYPYCTDSSSYIFQNRNLLFCISVVNALEMCILLRVWFLIINEKNISCWTLLFFRFILHIYHYCTENSQLYNCSVVLISDMYIFVWFDAWQFMKKYYISTQCVQNLEIPYVLLFFYILPPWGDNNIDVQNDYNIVRSEEVYTSDHTDEFKTSQKTCLRWKYISIFSSFFYFYIHIQSRNNWWN